MPSDEWDFEGPPLPQEPAPDAPEVDGFGNNDALPPLPVGAQKLPPILCKAIYDNCWYYVLETITGAQFLFTGITVINDEWIHLEPLDSDIPSGCFDAPVGSEAYRVHDRGIDVRIDSIVWVGDGIS